MADKDEPDPLVTESKVAEYPTKAFRYGYLLGFEQGLRTELPEVADD